MKINTLYPMLLLAGALFLGSCQEKEEFVLPEPPAVAFDDAYYSDFRFVGAAASELATKISDLSQPVAPLELYVSTQKEAQTIEVLSDEATLNKALLRYKALSKEPGYTLLPASAYTLTVSPVAAGETSATVNLQLQEGLELPYGLYLVPVVLRLGDHSAVHYYVITQEGKYVALSDDNPKPLPPSRPNYVRPIKLVTYVETNDWDPRNIMNFVLKDSRRPVFDLVVFFASNMNYNGKDDKRYLFFNDKLQPIMDNREVYIDPIKARGIKVLTSILPNHQGVGFNNFRSYEEALDFCQKLKEAAERCGLDGYDTDEEYADYPGSGTLRPTNSLQSWFWYLKAFKEVMPEKLLTLYEYGVPYRVYNTPVDGKYARDYFDYSWSDYWVRGSSSMQMPPMRYGNRSYEAARADLDPSWTARYAQATLDDNQGLYMIFCIRGTQIKDGSAVRALSALTQIFYGEDCEFAGPYYAGPRDRQ